MESAAILGMSAKFISVAGEIFADLKRQDIAVIDADLLSLKWSRLSEEFEALRADVVKATVRNKADAQQKLISRGLANSTVLDSMFRQIDQDAADEVGKASKEYNRNLEEIALMERKIAEQNKPWWKKFLSLVGIRR